MYAEKLQPGSNAAYAVSRLMYEPHIYAALPDNLRDVYFAHRFLCEIEEADRWVIGVFSKEDDLLLGVVHGCLEDGNFIAHTMFRRKVDAVRGALLCEEVLIDFCRKYGIELKAIVGYPPEHLRASVRMSRQFGCVDCGLAEHITYIHNGRKIPCRYFRKEIR